MRKYLIKLTLPTLFRAAVAAALLYWIYRETGPLTAAALTLITVYIEAHHIQHRTEALRGSLSGSLSELFSLLGAKKPKKR